MVETPNLSSIQQQIAELTTLVTQATDDTKPPKLWEEQDNRISKLEARMTMTQIYMKQILGILTGRTEEQQNDNLSWLSKLISWENLVDIEEQEQTISENAQVSTPNLLKTDGMKILEKLGKNTATYYDTGWRAKDKLVSMDNKGVNHDAKIEKSDVPYVPCTHEGLLTWKYASMNSVDFLIEKNLNASVTNNISATVPSGDDVALLNRMEDRPLTPPKGEEEFTDDDGTRYKWDRSMRPWVPQDDISTKNENYGVEEMTFLKEYEVFPTVSATDVAVADASVREDVNGNVNQAKFEQKWDKFITKQVDIRMKKKLKKVEERMLSWGGCDDAKVTVSATVVLRNMFTPIKMKADAYYNSRLLFGYTSVRSYSVAGELRLSEPIEIFFLKFQMVEMIALIGKKIDGDVLNVVEVIPIVETQQWVWGKYKKDVGYKFGSIELPIHEPYLTIGFLPLHSDGLRVGQLVTLKRRNERPKDIGKNKVSQNNGEVLYEVNVNSDRPPTLLWCLEFTVHKNLLVRWMNLNSNHDTWEAHTILRPRFQSFDPWGQGSFHGGGIVMHRGEEVRLGARELGKLEKGLLYSVQQGLPAVGLSLFDSMALPTRKIVPTSNKIARELDEIYKDLHQLDLAIEHNFLSYSFPNSAMSPPRFGSILPRKNLKTEIQTSPPQVDKLVKKHPSLKSSMFRKSKSCGDGRTCAPPDELDDLWMYEANAFHYNKHHPHGSLISNPDFPTRAYQGQASKAQKEATMMENNNNDAISRTVSLEKFECGSWASSTIIPDLDVDEGDSMNTYFDLPLKLIKNIRNNSSLPVSAAFMFDDKDVKGVLKNGSTQTRSTGRKSHESSSSRYVRFTTSCPTSYPASAASCITPRLRKARDNLMLS
ncbi:Cupredoxin superfamily protein isoform 1 [Hibiscus syriacus]|uniref:Cupredoxin superfamily protein isoform 1 n=2 Tax=Hibiscus syriacus TaxID=106335 RepID=A0A6A3BLV2_HIBSY|nr:Cupredoxin superfamily protein isoform 1 [Hibiscus syriacus]